jgi:uncharacterized protein (TIGR03382 family)
MNRFSQALFVSCLLFAAPAFADVAVDLRRDSPKVDVEARPDEIATHEEAVKPDEAAAPEESAKLEEKEATKTSGCSTTGGDIALFSVLAGFGLVFVGRKRR